MKRRADIDERAMLMRYVREKLKDSSTYVVALVVGTFINLYGHILVPWLRGSTDPLGAFIVELRAHPLVILLSMVLAYCFPFAVGTFSAVATRFKNRGFELKAIFPDSKPDPVFRADREGRFLDMGATTEAFFRERRLANAVAVLGEEAWRACVNASRDAERSTGTVLHSRSLDRWFAVSQSCGPNDSINIYMTEVRPDASTDLGSAASTV